MSIGGQRVNINLDGDGPLVQPHSQSAPQIDFVGDVLERNVGVAAPPKPLTPRFTEGGFPAHKKRLGQSRFKQQRTQGDSSDVLPKQKAVAPAVKAPAKTTLESDEKHQIDLENRMKLASMSDDEIQNERQELLDGLKPSLLQALLRRAEYKPGGDDADFPGVGGEIAAQALPKQAPRKPSKKVTFAEAPPEETNAGNDETGDVLTNSAHAPQREHADMHEDDGTNSLPPDVFPVDEFHFPRPQQPPELDPSSDSFLEDLHKKYFPSLPADPDKLEWMRPASGPNPYSPTQNGLDPKDIRFAFSGALIPPTAASQIPVSVGLHHHGDAPDAAGYTISELARLARSSVPAQRCIAFQTLGRIIYRLGKGEFGNPSDGTAGTVGAEDTFGELARGLWREVEREQVIEICTLESEGKTGMSRHVSAQAYATEAVWLWQKGGGRRHKSD
ncbi:hypothetical protein CAC42_1096 [Sphaceloma murrayae]|uniref:RNA polymerase II-associated protein RBA50 n=1 Tax=Sphaceloma murrayae TaxID=2082308 RepID=A0A2K1R209_9PEZI|nr:hypothetical protein CAC42_1096 [Sphaceloma murrayae]